jgi:hypothetical protein
MQGSRVCAEGRVRGRLTGATAPGMQTFGSAGTSSDKYRSHCRAFWSNVDGANYEGILSTINSTIRIYLILFSFSRYSILEQFSSNPRPTPSYPTPVVRTEVPTGARTSRLPSEVPVSRDRGGPQQASDLSIDMVSGTKSVSPVSSLTLHLTKLRCCTGHGWAVGLVSPFEKTCYKRRVYCTK